MREDLEESAKQILNDYEKAYRFDPLRAEPLAAMAIFFLKSNLALPAYLLARFGLSHPPPSTPMYIRREVYDEQLLFLLACAAQSLGRKEEAKAGYYKLLSKKELSENTRKRILGNLSLF